MSVQNDAIPRWMWTQTRAKSLDLAAARQYNTVTLSCKSLVFVSAVAVKVSSLLPCILFGLPICRSLSGFNAPCRSLVFEIPRIQWRGASNSTRMPSCYRSKQCKRSYVFVQ